MFPSNIWLYILIFVIVGVILSFPFKSKFQKNFFLANGKVVDLPMILSFLMIWGSIYLGFQAETDSWKDYRQGIFETAGLELAAKVHKIDDNGFVTFSLSPQVSAEVDVNSVDRCGNISIINTRALDTGKIRVRDGQTLVLTGVISDLDIQAVTKWPILGDMPLIGQFFRSSQGSRAKRELIILVTPRVIDDSQGSNYGYGYRPILPAARQIMSGS